jgi:hypothetical protein
MCDSKDGWFQQQFNFLRSQFLQEGNLPFTDVLSEESVSEALTAIEVRWNDRIYPPLVTLWVFLIQVLSADHSCRAAVARLIAHRISRKQGPCSSETGAYCQARKRLPIGASVESATYEESNAISTKLRSYVQVCAQNLRPPMIEAGRCKTPCNGTCVPTSSRALMTVRRAAPAS